MPLRLSVCFRNLKCRRGPATLKKDYAVPDYCFKLRKHSSDFQGKCLAFSFAGGITVAQQPANYTRFLFNSIPDEEDANLKTIIKVKNEMRRYINS